MTNNSPLGSEVSRLIDTAALEPHRRGLDEFSQARDWEQLRYRATWIKKK